MSSEKKEFPPALLIIDSSKVFTLDAPVIKIGRSEANDLILTSVHVSRKHAEIRFNKGKFEISDLGSKAGTFVNGEKIDRRILSKGDVITLANIHLVFGEEDIPTDDAPSKYVRPQQEKQPYRETNTLPYIVEDDNEIDV
ncbi:MAG: FHA domain-containing protein [Anaerolineales bacterium]|nr:FHA domain-containing protein [Chloroflexota bacterium]MBL6982101.1 FHA domain-containing protein [Anaerolineales bacterium]